MVPPRRPGGHQVIPRPADWSIGPDPAWPIGVQPSVADLIAGLDDGDYPKLADLVRASAVLVLIHNSDAGPELLLTRRADTLTHHRGEISFPGGRIDPGESSIEAALREASEEVGLDPTTITVHGRLRSFRTAGSHHDVIPHVATIDHRPTLTPYETEVARIIWVPIAELTRPDTYRSERWAIGAASYVLHFFYLDDETVWGATARILNDLLARAASHTSSG
ncbi:MAG: coenzyme A pyrophosphatase [Ilumatobacter coccineus]|uniref:Coenzyme A pyrophosphatase n=1 Tax=Ilumatobacter coccineus TaxID=467094 RepID=A0A2G6KBF0_9ACTN|nr:MAG: coenzyme A pyrophosphatase [Ilumatobacter coccineus]